MVRKLLGKQSPVTGLRVRVAPSPPSFGEKPNGEEAASKAVARHWVAGSTPVLSANSSRSSRAEHPSLLRSVRFRQLLGAEGYGDAGVESGRLVHFAGLWSNGYDGSLSRC